jgi:L-alanine-DL-glutamate epimerase-like enolase superfamily enzyme
MPLLATAMCASPFDAAIHDAVGQAMGISAMELYRDQPIPTSADKWFTGSSAYAAIGRMLNRQPRKHFPAWLLVGKNDDLENDVRPWYHNRGYRYFKLKLHGQDLREDVERTVDVVNASRSWQCMPTLSVDTNEACHDAAYVQEYLNQLLAKDTVAFGCLKYLEQPTARDIAANPHDWKQVSQRKPILLDEGLTSLDRLPLAVEQGWSGLALKTCKGHSFALVAAAWAMENNLMLAMQDLTNPGYSAMHSAIFAAYVPTINGVELNSPQFTPAANAPFINEWSGLLNVTDGYHHLPKHIPTGLGGNIML